MNDLSNPVPESVFSSFEFYGQWRNIHSRLELSLSPESFRVPFFMGQFAVGVE
jgi:hypothetical protein